MRDGGGGGKQVGGVLNGFREDIRGREGRVKKGLWEDGTYRRGRVFNGIVGARGGGGRVLNGIVGGWKR